MTYFITALTNDRARLIVSETCTSDREVAEVVIAHLTAKGHYLSLRSEDEPEENKVYWSGVLSPKDDYGRVLGEFMYDSKTKEGPWALMSEMSWKQHGVGRLGQGYGQKYKKQPDGRWLKIDG